MIERKLFQDTFSALHASEKSIQEVLAMSEEKKNTAARFRRPRRAPADRCRRYGITVVSVPAPPMPPRTERWAQAIELHIAQAFQINEYKDVRKPKKALPS